MKADEECHEFEEAHMHTFELSDLGKFDNIFFDSDFFEENSEHRNAACSNLGEREERVYNTPAGPHTELALESRVELAIDALLFNDRSAR